MKATVRIQKDDRGNSWVLVDQEEIQRIAEEKAKGNDDLATAWACVKIPLKGILVVLPLCSSVMSKEKNE